MGPHHGKHCVQCNYEIQSWEDHQQHVRDAHNNQWKYVCGICEEVFDSQEDCNYHRRCNHTQTNKSVATFCHICGKGVKEASMKAHLATHGGEQFLCSQCPKVCISRVHLRRHERSAHFTLRDIPCNECDKVFKDRNAVALHKISVHTADEDKPFKCT